MEKWEVIKTIYDKRKSYDEIDSSIIKDYVGNFPQGGQLNFTFGVNVRLSNETNDIVKPFSYSFPKYDSAEAAREVLSGYSIPAFFERFCLKEVIFRVDFSYNNSVIEVKSVNKVGMLKTLLEKEWYTFNPLVESKNDEQLDKNIEKFFKESDRTFLHVNLIKMFKQGSNKESAYVWISGEDAYVSEDGKCVFLTTILVISNDSNKMKDFIENKRLSIIEFVLLLKNLKIEEAVYKQKMESVKSAKAAIMSRNLSHNLGSHVMFYIKQKLETVNSIYKEGTLEKLIQVKDFEDFKEKLKQNQKVISDYDEMPFLVGLGRFINYLQERQDYIATVATNHIPYRTTINFKDAIYDELKLEKRVERHILDENAKDRKADNLLLDYIAYSEKFVSSDKIEIKFRKDNTDSNNYADDNYFDGSGTPLDVPSGLREFNVSLPGGNLGRQAFFSIMENIIRNTAKHESKHINNKKLTFLFDILQYTDIEDIYGYSWREGENNLQNESLNLIETYKNNKNDLYYLGITVVLKGDEIETSLYNINKGLRQDYLTPDDKKMDDQCKGLKEIRISAAWIRGKEIDSDIPINEPPAVAIRKTSEGYLQYIICISKPKKVAIVTPFIGLYNNSKLLSMGCQVFSHEDIHNSEKCGIIADYDLVIADKSIDNNNYNKIQSKVGARIFKWKKDGVIEERAIKDGYVYLEWIRSVYNIKNIVFPQISILDKKDVNVQCDETIKSFVKSRGTSEGDDSYYNNCIIFNIHYPGQSYLEEDDRKLFSKACFVEAISGGNSTDRLIRREKRDVEWYAKHVAASKAKISIIDERIYEMIMPKNIKLSDKERDEIKNKVSDFYNNDTKFANKIQILKEVLNTKSSETAANILRECDNSDELVKRIINYKENDKSLPDYSLAWKYRESGILAFNLEIIDNTTIHIIGYNAPVVDPIGLYSSDYEKGTVAVIKKTDDESVIKIESVIKSKIKVFDFVTVHQGILDKIYNLFGIKDESKNIVTEKLFDYFSKMEKIEITNEEQGNDSKVIFLPQFIIHSGRSKPNTKDMPQMQPFLQFSALEHGVRDCKYTLTELLYSAHYEKSDNYN